MDAGQTDGATTTSLRYVPVWRTLMEVVETMVRMDREAFLNTCKNIGRMQGPGTERCCWRRTFV